MELLPGSILSRSLPGFLGLFYVHMGIYLGNDTVIHYKGERKSRRNALLNKDSLHAFAEDYEVTVHAPPKNPDHAHRVCAEADKLYHMAVNDYNHRYHFMLNNCEDFCVHCYEQAPTTQRDKTAGGLVATLATIALWLLW